MAWPRVLITGFGPFPGVPENPSARLAERLVEQVAPDLDAEIHAWILPTEWHATLLMPRLYETLQPHVMIHFGVDQRARALRIERFAHNRTSARADAAGTLPLGSVIAPEGPERHGTKLPAAAIAAHLRRRGLQAVVSRSAGDYLCNFLYYHSLDWARERHCLVLFVHLPPLRSAGSLNDEALLIGATEILRFALVAAHTQESAPRRALVQIDAVLSGKEAGDEHRAQASAAGQPGLRRLFGCGTSPRRSAPRVRPVVLFHPRDRSWRRRDRSDCDLAARGGRGC